MDSVDFCLNCRGYCPKCRCQFVRLNPIQGMTCFGKRPAREIQESPDVSLQPAKSRHQRIMIEAEPIVFVVDDDPSVHRSIERLIQSSGFKVQTFPSAGEFLRRPRPEGPACLVLDVLLPGLSSLDLKRELANFGIQLPIIFMTAHGDIPMTVRAMEGRAMEFLTKPFRTRHLLDAIRAAIERDRDTLKQRTQGRATAQLL
jgi:FixJ family two-component response regulator